MSTNKAKLEALLKLINSAALEAIAEYEKAGDDVPSIDSTAFHPLDDALDQVALKKAVRTLEGACAQLCATLAPPSHTVINLVQAYDYACIRVALQENITDILSDHPNGIHANDLSKIVNIEPKKLARVLRILATRGCYNEVDTDTFTNNRLSLVLHSKNPVRDMANLQLEGACKGASVLYDTLKDPKTAYSENAIHSPAMYAINNGDSSITFYQWLEQQDQERQGFNRAMIGINSITSSLAVVTQFPFEKYSTIVDVGGGVGGFALPLAKAHKHLKITIQDLPNILTHARDIWAKDYPEAVQETRVEFVDLDFFVQIPVKGKDIYYLRNIIHGWPDHKATVILHNLRQALGPHSRVLIHDYVLRELSRKRADAEAASLGVVVAPEPMLPNFGVGNLRMYQKDLTMWLAHNGKERSLQDFLRLATAAGLKLEKVWDLAETSVLEFSVA